MARPERVSEGVADREGTHGRGDVARGPHVEAGQQEPHQRVGQHEACRGAGLDADPLHGGGEPQHREHGGEQRHAVRDVVVVEGGRVPGEDHPRPPHRHEKPQEPRGPGEARVVVQPPRERGYRDDEAQVEEELQRGGRALLGALLGGEVTQHRWTNEARPGPLLSLRRDALGASWRVGLRRLAQVLSSLEPGAPAKASRSAMEKLPVHVVARVADERHPLAVAW